VHRGGGTADQGLLLSDKAFEPQGHFSHCQALLLKLDGYHGAFPFLRVKRRDTGTGSMVQRGRGASHRPALHSNAHRAHVCVQWGLKQCGYWGGGGHCWPRTITTRQGNWAPRPFWPLLAPAPATWWFPWELGIGLELCSWWYNYGTKRRDTWPGSSVQRGMHTGVGSSTQMVGDHCILGWGELLCSS